MHSAQAVSFVEQFVKDEGVVFSIRPVTISGAVGLDESNPFSLLRPVDIAQLYDEVEGDMPWVLDGYLVKGGLTLLAGPPKLGKTTLAYQILAAIAEGVPFLGKTVAQSKVLLLGVEEHRRDITQRLFDSGTKDLSGLVKVEFGPVPFNETSQKELVVYVKQEQIGLVVIDTLPVWWNLADESNAAEVITKGALLLKAIRNTDAAWLCLVHARKGGGEHGEEIRGSSALAGLADIAISMKRTPAGDPQRSLETISRYAETPRSLTIELEKDVYRALGTPEEVSAAARAERVWTVLTDIDQRTDELCEITDLSKQDLSLAVGRLGDNVVRTGKGHKGDPYRYRRNPIRPSSNSEVEVLDKSTQPIEPTHDNAQ